MVVTEHRKRVKHFDLHGDAHFLTFSCYRRMQLLSKDRTRLWLVEALHNAQAGPNVLSRIISLVGFS